MTETGAKMGCCNQVYLIPRPLESYSNWSALMTLTDAFLQAVPGGFATKPKPTCDCNRADPPRVGTVDQRTDEQVRAEELHPLAGCAGIVAPKDQKHRCDVTTSRQRLDAVPLHGNDRPCRAPPASVMRCACTAERVPDSKRPQSAWSFRPWSYDDCKRSMPNISCRGP